jgi:hypothetical protein
LFTLALYGSQALEQKIFYTERNKLTHMPTQQLDYFASLVSEDEHFPLTEAAIAAAQHAYPDLIIQNVMDELDLMGDKVKHRVTHEMQDIQKLQILKNFFFKELGFGPTIPITLTYTALLRHVEGYLFLWRSSSWN